MECPSGYKDDEISLVLCPWWCTWRQARARCGRFQRAARSLFLSFVVLRVTVRQQNQDEQLRKEQEELRQKEQQEQRQKEQQEQRQKEHKSSAVAAIEWQMVILEMPAP